MRVHVAFQSKNFTFHGILPLRRRDSLRKLLCVNQIATRKILSPDENLYPYHIDRYDKNTYLKGKQNQNRSR